MAFCIYGLSEYYQATNSITALEKAKEFYTLIEKYSYDPEYGGYLEAFTGNWQLLDDLRLSDKDANEKKTMNTHLHVLEAYANLYSVWKDEKLGKAIQQLLSIFWIRSLTLKLINNILFFTQEWEIRSSVISYGHDIEASWLLNEAAIAINDPVILDRIEKNAVGMAAAVLSGVDEDGGLWYEFDPAKNEYNKEKHWWPQAEAMVGFFNAYQLTGEDKYLSSSLNSWSYIKKYLKDKVHGEWIWGIDENGLPMQKEKAGFWKCPYHNGRACLEMMKRISSVFDIS